MVPHLSSSLPVCVVHRNIRIHSPPFMIGYPVFRKGFFPGVDLPPSHILLLKDLVQRTRSPDTGGFLDLKLVSTSIRPGWNPWPVATIWSKVLVRSSSHHILRRL